MIDANDIMNMIKRCVRPLQNKIAMLVGRCVLAATNDSEGIQKIKMSVLAGEVMENIERMQNYGMTSHVPDGGEGLVVFPFGNREHGICVAMDNRNFRIKNLEKGEVAIYTDEGDQIILKRGNNIEVICGNKVTINAENELAVNTKKITENATTEITRTTQADKTTAATHEVTASATSTITAPVIQLNGLVQIAGGLAVGGAAGAPTTATFTGGISTTQTIASGADVTATGEVSDSTRSMSADRTIYNSHTHVSNGNGNPTDPTTQTQ